MNDDPAAPTVLVVDDHAGFRATARRLLEGDGWRVVGEAADAASAIESAARLVPDVVLLDICLPDHDGFNVAERLAEARADDGKPAIVLVSGRERGAYGRRIAMSPARGFISKDELDGAGLRDLLASGRTDTTDAPQ